MKHKLSLLDCTLRDGGYRNHWGFGQQAMLDIAQSVQQAGIEYIELGFLETGYDDKEGYAKFSCPTKTHDYTENLVHTKSMCMLRDDRLDINALVPQESTQVKIIRYLFSVDNTSQAIKNIHTLIGLGYRLFLQPFGTKYANMDLLKEVINALPAEGIEAISIVDTYGNMLPDETTAHINWLDELLTPDVAIGLHFHDNSGLAMANLFAILNAHSSRHFIIDSCITGFGLGAGNLKTEQVICVINQLQDATYDITPLLDTIDYHFTAARADTALLASAALHLHPKYAMYLLDQPDLSLSDIWHHLQQVPSSYRGKFDDASIRHAYAKVL